MNGKASENSKFFDRTMESDEENRNMEEFIEKMTRG
jgi:hypothetical protein